MTTYFSRVKRDKRMEHNGTFEIDWIRLYRSYLPDIIDSYTDHYEDIRNKKRIKWTTPEQNKYSVNKKCYGGDFWKEVLNQHLQHRISYNQSLPFLYHLTGRCTPWPDMLRRFPGIIRSDDRLTSRYYSFATKRNPIGLFSKNTKGQVYELLADETSDAWDSNPTVICYYILNPECWINLIDPECGHNRYNMAMWLDSLLDDGLLETVEKTLGPDLSHFIKFIDPEPPHEQQPENETGG